MMIGKRYVEYYWLVTWCFLTPFLIILLFVMMSITFETPIINGVPLPKWAVDFGWAISALILFPIPICFVNEIYKAYKIKEQLRVSHSS